MCGSFRHYDEMLALRAVLLASGASCEWPTIDHRRDLSTQRTLSANGPDFPGLTRRVMGPVRLRLAARGAPQGEGARVTDKTDKMVMGRWPTQIERELAGVIF